MRSTLRGKHGLFETLQSLGVHQPAAGPVPFRVFPRLKEALPRFSLILSIYIVPSAAASGIFGNALPRSLDFVRDLARLLARAAQPRFERGLDGSEPSGLPLADRAI